jgi:hypothetical protein
MKQADRVIDMNALHGLYLPRLEFRIVRILRHFSIQIHCKKELAVFPSPAGMSLIKLFLGGNNLVFSRPERVWSVTSRLGTGKWPTLFYSVHICLHFMLAVGTIMAAAARKVCVRLATESKLYRHFMQMTSFASFFLNQA